MGGHLDQSETDELAPDGRVMYLRCGLCTICIGPGFYMEEVWFDPVVKKRLCRRCGQFHADRGAFRTATRDDLVGSGGGMGLITLLKAREKAGTHV